MWDGGLVPGVSHVGGIVDGGSTAVPEHAAPRERDKLFLR